eukprot:6323303-Prymnesium_polylepis.1
MFRARMSATQYPERCRHDLLEQSQSLLLIAEAKPDKALTKQFDAVHRLEVRVTKRSPPHRQGLLTKRQRLATVPHAEVQRPKRCDRDECVLVLCAQHLSHGSDSLETEWQRCTVVVHLCVLQGKVRYRVEGVRMLVADRPSPHSQHLLHELQSPSVVASGLFARHSEIVCDKEPLGVFGRPVAHERPTDLCEKNIDNTGKLLLACGTHGPAIRVVLGRKHQAVDVSKPSRAAAAATGGQQLGALGALAAHPADRVVHMGVGRWRPRALCWGVVRQPSSTQTTHTHST